MQDFLWAVRTNCIHAVRIVPWLNIFKPCVTCVLWEFIGVWSEAVRWCYGQDQLSGQQGSGASSPTYWGTSAQEHQTSVTHFLQGKAALVCWLYTLESWQLMNWLTVWQYEVLSMSCSIQTYRFRSFIAICKQFEEETKISLCCTVCGTLLCVQTLPVGCDCNFPQRIFTGHWASAWLCSVGLGCKADCHW